MKGLFELVKNELLQQRYLKGIYLLFISIFTLTILSSWSQVMLYNSDKENYNQIRQSYVETGIDVHKALSQDYTAKEHHSALQISNDLKYAYVKGQKDITAMLPQNSVNQVLSSAMFICLPLLLALYTISTALSDIKNKTFKVKYNRHSINSLILAKLVSLWIVGILSLGITCLTFALNQLTFGRFIHDQATFKVTSSFIQQHTYIDKAPLQLIVILLMLCCVITASYYLALTLKSSLLSLSIFGIYYLALPPLGSLDFKQNMLLLYQKIFYGQSSTFTPTQLNASFSGTSLFECGILIFSAIVISHYFVQRRGYLFL